MIEYLRLTPLQHYMFHAGGDGIHLVLDETNAFRKDNFATAMSVLQYGAAAQFVACIECAAMIRMYILGI